jgi:hypothetical protein
MPKETAHATDPFPIIEPVIDAAKSDIGDTLRESSIEIVEATALEPFSAILQQA